jgi:hypothetical protein
MPRLDWDRARERDAVRSDRPTRAVRPSWRHQAATHAQVRLLTRLARQQGRKLPPRHFNRAQAAQLIDDWLRAA